MKNTNGTLLKKAGGFVATLALGLLSSTSAFATSSFEYNCRATHVDAEAEVNWIYELRVLGNSGTMGPVQFYTGAKLSVTRYDGPFASDSGFFTEYVKNVDVEVLYTGDGVFEFMLPGSEHGLYGVFDTNLGVSGELKINHFLDENVSIVTPRDLATCSVDEVG